MPLKDHIKALKSEFNNIKQEVKKFQGQGQSQSQGQGQGQGQQSSYYPGQAQQQGYGGQPQQSQGQYGAQYGAQQYSQQHYQTPGSQNYQPPGWQAPNQNSQPGWDPQRQQQAGQHQQQFAPPAGQHQQPPQPQQHNPPPPVPYGSHPGSTPHQSPQHPNPTTYYYPQFHPSTPVSTYFEHKIGNNNGWGNAELQHYTSSPSNSFHTPDNKLVIRAISQPKHSDPSQRYTSARLVSHQKLDRPSGCLTAVITSSSAIGIWPAFWLLPSEPFSWPSDGEVDIAESWNADPTNHTCLHWGHFNGQDSQKHRVVTTPLPNISGRAVKYEFCWQQDDSGRGRMLWLIDGKAVMKASIPDGVRRLREWNVVINVAMGGNVCQGRVPGQGQWDMVVHEVRMSGEPDGGWGRVEGMWKAAREGNTM